jgi:hypothetical protein
MPILRKFASPPKVSNEKRGESGPNLPAPYGGAFGGGFFAGQISTSANGVATHNLVIAPTSSVSGIIQYKTSNSTDVFADSRIDGPGISAQMNSATYPAGQYCEGLTNGGYTDWYLPALDELAVAYTNLKPSAGGNNTSFGPNIYSVPPRTTNYTAGNPPQTTSAAFQAGGAEEGPNNHWVSTQQSTASGYPGADGTSAIYISFGTGSQNGYLKTNNQYFRARAMRRVAV